MHRTVLSCVSLLLPVWAGAMECAETLDAATFNGHLVKAGAAYAALEVDQFLTHIDDAAFALPCLNQPLEPELVARYHRLQGISWFLRDDKDRATASFSAARTTIDAPLGLVPEGHALHTLYDNAPRAGVIEALPEVYKGAMWINGLRQTDRPTEWPALLQIVHNDGHWTNTYLYPADPVPEYLSRDAVKAQRSKRTANKPLLATSGALALGAGALYGAALASKGQLSQPDNSLDDAGLESLQQRNHSMVLASGVGGGLAVVSFGLSWVL